MWLVIRNAAVSLHRLYPTCLERSANATRRDHSQIGFKYLGVLNVNGETRYDDCVEGIKRDKADRMQRHHRLFEY